MKKIYCLLFMVFLTCFNLYSQMYMENDSVHSEVYLDLTNTNKGLVLPYASLSDRNSILNNLDEPPDGMMMFDTQDNHIYYYQSYRDNGGANNGDGGPPWCCWIRVITNDELDAYQDTLNEKLNIIESELNRLQDSLALLANENWNIIDEAQMNGWYNVHPNYYKFSYRKDNYNNLYLRGYIDTDNSSPAGDIIFTLPEAYWPNFEQNFVGKFVGSVRYNNLTSQYEHRWVGFKVETNGNITCTHYHNDDDFPGIIITLQTIRLD